MIAGLSALLLGIIGAVLPLLPTTPFILLAAYCFSKGHTPLHQWLLRSKAFGPLIIDWQNHGVISMKAKIISTIMIIPLFTYTLGWVKVPYPVAIKSVVFLTGVLVLYFIWSRPHRK